LDTGTSQRNVLNGRTVAVAIVALAVFAAWWTHGRAGPAGSVSPSQRAQPLVPSGRVGEFSFLALGDSYTIGQGIAAVDRWPMQAAAVRAAGVDLADPAILAHSGWSTGDLLRAMDAAQLASHYDCVTLMIGVNNQYQRRPVEEYRQQFQTLLDRATRLAGGNAQRVVVLSIPDWSVANGMSGGHAGGGSPDIDRFNAACHDLTKRAGAAWVDVTPISRDAAGDEAMFAADRLQPSAKQYALWTTPAAAAIAASLK
jgi:lysophospholipase L1-like esterase